MRYIGRLTTALAQWLPPFWTLTQVWGPVAKAVLAALMLWLRSPPACWVSSQQQVPLNSVPRGMPRLQARLPGLASIGGAAESVEAGMAEAEAVAGRVTAAYRSAALA